MGKYIPPTPGYEQTYSMPEFKPMGMAGPLMGQNVARPYPGAPGPVFADQGNPNFPRSNGDANPFYKLSKVMPAVNPLGRQAVTGFPDRFNPVGAYATTGNPNIFNPAGAGFQPMGAYATTGNPNIFNPAGAGFQPMGAMDHTDDKLPSRLRNMRYGPPPMRGDTNNHDLFSMGAYPSASNPMGITPVGESLPAQMGHPARMGQGIGGSVESLGFMV